MAVKGAKTKNELGFVLEIGVEELPARHCREIIDSVLPKINELATSVGLKLENPRILLTPRRITLVANTLEPLNAISEFRGPAYDVASTNGKFNEIAKKFAEKNGGTIKNLEVRDLEDKKYVFFRKQVEIDLEESVGKLALLILGTPNFDRTMRWDDSGLAFSRPVRWVLALQGKKEICFDIHGISSGRTTFGPRFADSKAITISHSNKYLETLGNNNVVVDHAKRGERIRNALVALEKKGLTAWYSELPLEEVIFLVENPIPVLCEFEKRFLDLPAEIIEAVLVKHQRYFPLYDKSSKKITNMFLVIANHSNSTPEIKSGNEKVIKARLSDGLFFYEQDMKYNLDHFNAQISKIIFQEKLGSLADKVDRVGKLAKNLPREFSNIKNLVSEAAKYMKADQTTTLVSEFSSLEGVVGRIYAVKEGLDRRVATALEEYYHPRSSDDVVPETELGQLLGVLDRYDSLYGLFSIGFEPKGTSDPYGLRRAANGLARILWESELKLTLKDLEKLTAKIYSNKANIENLNKFILDRLVEEVRSESHIEIKYIRAVLNNTSPYFYQKRKVLDHMFGLIGSSKLEEFLDFAKRVYNITVKRKLSHKENVKVALLNPSEKALYLAAKKLEEKEVVGLDDLLPLVKQGNEFFVKNMVMSEVESEKERRIAILNLVNDQISRVLDMDVFLHKELLS